jgi:hypothetical protein
MTGHPRNVLLQNVPLQNVLLPRQKCSFLIHRAETLPLMEQTDGIVLRRSHDTSLLIEWAGDTGPSLRGGPMTLSK